MSRSLVTKELLHESGQEQYRQMPNNQGSANTYFLFLTVQRKSSFLPSFLPFFLTCASRFSRLIMTSSLSQSPLHFLAHVICATTTTSSPNITPISSSSSADLPCSRVPSAPRSLFQGVASLHIPCHKTEAIYTEKRPLKRSHSSNQLSHVGTQFVPFIRHKPGSRTRKSAELQLKSRMQMKLKRQELHQKATKIKSLDNSPANEHQLLVLRMVFDEITMYPCDSWMVLIAIIIRRSVLFFSSHSNRPP